MRSTPSAWWARASSPLLEPCAPVSRGLGTLVKPAGIGARERRVARFHAVVLVVRVDDGGGDARGVEARVAHVGADDAVLHAAVDQIDLTRRKIDRALGSCDGEAGLDVPVELESG